MPERDRATPSADVDGWGPPEPAEGPATFKEVEAPPDTIMPKHRVCDGEPGSAFMA